MIGHEHRFGEEPSVDIRSRYDGFGEGQTLDDTNVLEGDRLTTWMGDRHSPAYCEGTSSDDGSILTGG